VTTYAYVRVSTAEQGRSGLGLAAQRQRIEDQGRSRGWGELTWETDEGWSGKNLDRPALARLLDRITAGDRLVVAKLDRLSRSTLDFAQLLKRSGEEGWSVVVLELDLDTGTAIGHFVVSILAAVAELERGLISERTSAALQAAKARGQRLGVGNRQMTSETLEVIVGLRKSGLSMGAIAARLNGEGVPTVRGGNKWHPSTVRSALRSHELDREAAGTMDIRGRPSAPSDSHRALRPAVETLHTSAEAQRVTTENNERSERCGLELPDTSASRSAAF
jgi:DNA invertase Pin-like site-specific DNA recombinase